MGFHCQSDARCFSPCIGRYRSDAPTSAPMKVKINVGSLSLGLAEKLNDGNIRLRLSVKLNVGSFSLMAEVNDHIIGLRL